MVRLGLIGLPPDWNREYPAALAELSGRVRVSAVFAHVTTRAQQALRYFPDARIQEGVLSIADRPDVDALLLLDMGWHRHSLFGQLCARQKPLYVAEHLSLDATTLEHLHATAILTGTTLMPEFRWRYTPASGRLQELLATNLGRPHCITLRTSQTLLPQFLECRDFWTLDALDWCSYILKRTPHRVTVHTEQEARTITVDFESAATDSRPIRTRLVFEPPGNQRQPGVVELCIEAESGAATIPNPEQIVWSDQSGSGEMTEDLTADRAAIHVIIDHFCRRVAGALIPVADIRDINRSLSTLSAIRGSLEHSGEPTIVQRS